MGGSSNGMAKPANMGGMQPQGGYQTQQMFIPKAGGNEAGMEEPPTSAPPGQQTGQPMPAPAAPGQPPGRTYFNDPNYNVLNFRDAPVGSGSIGLQMPGGYTGTPFLQQYGGQPAPYDNLHAQIRDAFNNYSTGAGRFGSNNASRYANFAGGSFWRPDSGNYNLGREFVGGPFAGPQYNPQNPMGRHPMSFNQPQGGPQGGPQGAPQQVAPKGAAQGGQMPGANPQVDHAANFQKLMQGGDMNMASMYGNYGGARDWFNKNQAQLKQQYGQGAIQNLLNIRAGNRVLDSGQEQQLMRMAGLNV